VIFLCGVFMKITIKTKLYASTALIAFIVLVLITIFVTSSVNSRKSLDLILQYEKENSLLQEIEISVINTWQYLTDASLTQDPDVLLEARQ
ncbi:MAG: hypothetical protein PQJ50_00185, partial [Spirochaetales bacterium]|nr:hypothetical protein [Spirochaetales bacterium]